MLVSFFRRELHGAQIFLPSLTKVKQKTHCTFWQSGDDVAAYETLSSGICNAVGLVSNQEWRPVGDSYVATSSQFVLSKLPLFADKSNPGAGFYVVYVRVFFFCAVTCDRLVRSFAFTSERC